MVQVPADHDYDMFIFADGYWAEHDAFYLSPGDHHVLEIGTGWGSFAIHAAKNYGCRVTTTTISDNQFQYASELISKEGLEDKITLLSQDYRELKGSFDKVVSIEMIEAVGAE